MRSEHTFNPEMTQGLVFQILKTMTIMDTKGGDPHFVDFYKHYDFSKMVSYYCRGYDLNGSSCEARDHKRLFLINNNEYRVFEVPNKRNRGLRMTGNFVCLIECLRSNSHYWILTKMDHKIKTNSGQAIEYVDFHDTCEFTMSYSNGDVYPYILNVYGACCRGYRSACFDDDDNRKELGYHTTRKAMNARYGIKLL